MFYWSVQSWFEAVESALRKTGDLRSLCVCVCVDVLVSHATLNKVTSCVDLTCSSRWEDLFFRSDASWEHGPGEFHSLWMFLKPQKWRLVVDKFWYFALIDSHQTASDWDLESFPEALILGWRMFPCLRLGRSQTLTGNTTVTWLEKWPMKKPWLSRCHFALILNKATITPTVCFLWSGAEWKI